MPLAPGSSRKAIGENIAELRMSGRPEAQSVAIALRIAGQAKRSAPDPGGHKGRYTRARNRHMRQEAV